ncbi:preprotein translocase subunit YajC [Estrella lausannensis]|uniref:Sec translocon accessory complex subunit YajC n=1 Tax=Estrella lausannensis TaxID=483423 RepID=A0A0H5DQ48_9BACT|nr:preprotein translocase subunit YajC [Estrella lausannensis]CRX37649.1 Preprotein translocase subunit YajC [Estrella lausannensis]
MKPLAAALAVLLFQAQAVFAEGELGPGSPTQSMMQTFVMVGVAALFFYVILWRPEQKRRKAMEEQRKSLKKGDRVTAMGIVGIVAKIDEHTLTLRNPDGSKIEVLKAAITDVQPMGGSSEEEKKEGN